MAQREKCGYCGARNESVSMHSGIMECQACWYDRKMNLPAAGHWAKVGADFVSNIDAWDWQAYVPSALEWYNKSPASIADNEKHGPLTRDAFITAVRVARALRDFSDEYLKPDVRHLVKQQPND